jgi:hypothetical protein
MKPITTKQWKDPSLQSDLSHSKKWMKEERSVNQLKHRTDFIQFILQMHTYGKM